MENTQVEETDIKERIEGFNKELMPLLAKYELGLAAFPRITPDGRVVADPSLLSMRGKEEAKKEEAPADAGLTKE